MNMEISEAPDKLQVKSGAKFKILFIVVTAVVLLIVGALVSMMIWYNVALKSVSREANATAYTVNDGQTVRQIAMNLQADHLIRSGLAFRVYMRLHGGAIKAGTYHLDQKMSLPTIAGILVSGKQSNYDITFYPGATISPVKTTDEAERLDATTMLKRAGFSDQEIKDALDANYDSPLFASRPKTASLEGYVYGDTYQVDSSASAKTVLQTTFNTFWQKISEKNLVEGLKKRGFNLYQGITLASIVQAEASNPDDQRQIAQVFELRLKKKMPLGSDVTFIYAAGQLGVKATPDLKSPYNTRIHTGLPPGPINTPGIGALEAVAAPAKGDYLYFVAGDNGKIYYAKTIEQHETNIKKYCAKLCS